MCKLYATSTSNLATATYFLILKSLSRTYTVIINIYLACS